LYFRAGIRFAQYIQASAYQFGAFAHASQAEVPRMPVLGQNLWVDAFSVVPYTHTKLPAVKPDLHLDSLRLGMP
jgi:hypothetical protein